MLGKYWGLLTDYNQKCLSEKASKRISTEPGNEIIGQFPATRLPGVSISETGMCSVGPELVSRWGD
jgi:hypothetical protein